MQLLHWYPETTSAPQFGHGATSRPYVTTTKPGVRPARNTHGIHKVKRQHCSPSLVVSPFDLLADDVIPLSSHLSGVGIFLGQTCARILEPLRYILHRCSIPFSSRPPHPSENPIPDANRIQFLLILRPSACVPPSMINAAMRTAAIRMSRTYSGTASAPTDIPKHLAHRGTWRFRKEKLRSGS